MPFGPTNTPATFQALMNEVLRPFLRRFVLVFFDDILVYCQSWAEHLQHMHAVFAALRAHGLVLKKSKCSFGEQSMAYLGHVISCTVRALCRSLGLAGYYRKYVKDYGALVAPLTQLLRKDSFVWSPVAAEAFQYLKTALITAPVLTLPNFSKSAGPVAFFSRSLAPRHQGLAAYERELIGLVQAVRHWRPYLWGRPFVVKTDHYSLKFLLDQRLATLPQHHWVSKLLAFDFSMEYKPRASNMVADALSRRDSDTVTAFAISGPSFDIVRDVRTAATSDPTLVALIDHVAAGTLGTPWSVVDGILLYDGKFYLPPDSPLLQVAISNAHDAAHEGVEKSLRRFRRDFHTPVSATRRITFTLLPLPMPTSVWSDISMDFIEGLPKVGGKSVILTVVDRFSKYEHFIALSHPYSLNQWLQLSSGRWFGCMACPPQLCLTAIRCSHQHFGKLSSLSWLHMSSAFHPQSDGQSEAVNKTISMYLRCITGDRPRQWLRWLPWAEFVYNTAYHSKGDTVVYGQEPPTIRSYDSGDCKVAVVAQAMEEEFLADVRARLLQAQEMAKRNYDRGHRDLSFAVGDWVWLCLRHCAPASLQVAKGKLRPRYYGPYSVLLSIQWPTSWNCHHVPAFMMCFMWAP
ncbi:LOW QUALITY PROTEIN: hypothetical protein U9M48_012652 [Paspalum notatum var. saurae]|uniref:Reverse transcriptase domain-containing protein n=1 Tax=Paspalum notatum var. saurae TaxID=547442 RepID=A0AAQ3WIY9_PASNO